MPHEDRWADLLGRVKSSRSRDAPFFKPACLIAAIDLIDEGEIDPASMDAERIYARVSQLVDSVHTGRPEMRWRPVWHLSNDGAWIFTKAGRRVGPDDFKRARKPDTYREWRDSFDHLSVPEDRLADWRSLEHRAALREPAIALLRTGDAACRRLADELSQTGPGPSSAPGQGFSSDAVANRAVEEHAMSLARDWCLSEGWVVQDRSATESYDLFGRRGGDVLYIEVKGTTGDGGTIQLTRLEVEFASTHREQMALVVVHGIELEETASGPRAHGGVMIVRQPWAPAPGCLQPIAFICQLGRDALS